MYRIIEGLTSLRYFKIKQQHNFLRSEQNKIIVRFLNFKNLTIKVFPILCWSQKKFKLENRVTESH